MRLEHILRGVAGFDNTYRYYPVGQYSDKEGNGVLYYDAIKDDFFKEKEFRYLVSFDAPVKETLHRLFFFEKFYKK